MEKRKSNVKKTLIIATMILFSVSVLVVPGESSDFIDITPPISKTTLFQIPSGFQFKDIEILEHTKNTISAITPTIRYYTTDSKTQIEITEPVSESVYTYDILKKGINDYLRIFIPSSYYSKKEKITNLHISLRIHLTEIPTTTSFTSQSYDPQATTYEYVIITNNILEPTFNDYFKAWKISSDTKISNILITNITNITSQSYGVNSSYGDATNTTSGNHWITDNTEVTSSYSLFNDTQAKIRNFLRYCYDEHNTRYVLLGGNKDIVPPRMVCSYAIDTCPGCVGSFHNDTSHASDMYYSCLHNNMNNNTNSYWMENDVCGSPWDDIDWGYDLCVGRILVDTPNEVKSWINKTKNYTLGSFQGNYLQNNIAASKNNGNAITDTNWFMIGDEFPSNITFLNNQNITQTQWSDIPNYVDGNNAPYDGFNMIFHAGHGGTLYTNYQPGLVSNDLLPNFLYTEGCHSADFGTDTTSRMEGWLPYNCLYAGISNSASGWFIASTYYVEEMVRQMFNTTTANFTLTYCQAHNDAREIYGHGTDCVWGMIVKETNFFGDPALDYIWYQEAADEIHFVTYTGWSNGTTINTSTPTFAWTRISNTARYHLEIANDFAFTNVVSNITDINEIIYPSYYSENTTTVVFELPPAFSLTSYKQYYCRVRAFYEGR